MQREVFEAYPKDKLAIYVVWLPMIPTDNEAAARRSAPMCSDSRLHQFYDPDRLSGIAFSKDVKPDQFKELMDSLPAEHPLRPKIADWFATPPEKRPLWDVVYFFQPSVTWRGASVPSPILWTKQMGYMGEGRGDGRTGLFFRKDFTKPPVESDWFDEVREGMKLLVATRRNPRAE